MKSKKLFLVILFITIFLSLLCIWIHKNSHLKYQNVELSGNKNKNCIRSTTRDKFTTN